MHICKYSSAPLQHPLSRCLQRACFLAYFQLGSVNKGGELVWLIFVRVPSGGKVHARDVQGAPWPTFRVIIAILWHGRPTKCSLLFNILASLRGVYCTPVHKHIFTLHCTEVTVVRSHHFHTDMLTVGVSQLTSHMERTSVHYWDCL